MRRAPLGVLLVLCGCKEKGPSEAELAAQAKDRQEREALCKSPGPRAQWAQLGALAKQVKAAAPVKEDRLPAERSFKFRELHVSDGVAATTDVNWLSDFEGPERGIIGSCVWRQNACRADDAYLKEALDGCATIDSYVVVRVLEAQRPKVQEGGGKYEGGAMTGEAFVFALGGSDGGEAQQLGAFTFTAKLSGQVELYRDYTSTQIQTALDEAMRKSAVRQLEALLTR